MKRSHEFSLLWETAHNAGMDAAMALTPRPMVVTEHENMLDDNSPVKQSWYVADGVCGFAWVTVHPGNCAFANWAKKYRRAKKAYGGGMMVKWVSEFNQSMQKKEAYAFAFAKVLQTASLRAYAGSRLD